VLLALFFKERITPLLSFSCLWYFISLSPKFYARLNLVAAEHQAYLAFFALYFMLGYLFSKTEKIKQAIRTKALKEIFPRYFFIFILSLFFLLTIIRNFQWRDENALWKATYKINPESGIAKGSLGLSFQNQNLFKEAEAFLKDSADSPAMGNSRATSLLNLATFYALRGELDKGMEILKQNRDYLLRFNKAGFYKTLGFVNMMMGRKEEARSVWQEALKMSAHNAKIKALLGMLYSEQFQDRQKAKQYYKEAISDDPDLVLARLGLALVLENEDSAAAIEQYEAAIKLNPQNFIPYFHLGLIYARSLLSTKAEWYFKKAIQLNPNAAGAHYNLAVYYLSLQEPDYKLALKYFNKAKALGYKVDKEIENLLTSADTPPSH
ncbi:MAG: tetratricopeptide repeat protein, partial [Candidatus Omnitrophica bacterium]|nr:tetratricopeptide repeat protein [Candidatus Omnitrophota bacterium]